MIKTTKGFYKIPEEVLKDIDFYRQEVERFLKGEVPPDRFKPFRVSRGVYAQRGQTTYMVRIKVPAGGLTPEQMERIAELSERYGNGIPHVTTRQDFQIHWVKIEDTPEVMKGLAEVGLTTKGGGGNTVRNVTACPDAGVCNREAFDVAPFAIALTEYFLSHPKAFNLPRKFKIAFSGCSDDCALATVNDVGFIAKKRVIDGKEVEGFAVYAAGGMGAHSRVADLIEEFIPKEDALYVAEAVMNLFYEHGNRRNKHRARLRFVMERYGHQRFTELYRQELEELKKDPAKRLDPKPLPLLRDLEAPVKVKGLPPSERAAFEEWKRWNVRPQKQEGFYYAKIRLTVGDITSGDLKNLARIVRDYGEGSIRTTHNQNMVIRWLRTDELPALYMDLKGIGLAEKGAGRVDDVLCCPGAATCNLGICLSKNMALVLSDELKRSDLPLDDLQGVEIKISGCPNSCGQHPVGTIGLHGAARRGDGRMAPHYEVLLGGKVEEGHTRLGKPFGFVPAKAIPSCMKEILRSFAEGRKEGEDFHSFLERKEGDLKEIVTRHARLPQYEEARDYYMDWGAKEEFSLAGLGPGECGAGVFDMIESDINDAKRHLEAARDAMVGKIDKDAGEELYKALLSAAKALLIVRGVEPTDDLEAFRVFEEQFVDKGLLPEGFRGLQKKGAQFLSGLLDEEGLKEGLGFVEDLVRRVEGLYQSLDDSLRFRAEKEEEKEEEKGPSREGATAFMDLRGVKCPINYVKAKIKLEEMEEGETLLLYLDDGEPIRNVPSSLRNDGQEILRMKKVDDHYELLVKKVV